MADGANAVETLAISVREMLLAQKEIPPSIKVIGRGATRVVVELDDTRVLKVARPHLEAINLREANVWRDCPPHLRRHLCPVLEADPNGRWLVMARCQDITDRDAYRGALTELIKVLRPLKIGEIGWGNVGLLNGHLVQYDYELYEDATLE
jgi:hypothetical protein